MAHNGSKEATFRCARLSWKVLLPWRRGTKGCNGSSEMVDFGSTERH